MSTSCNKKNKTKFDYDSLYQINYQTKFEEKYYQTNKVLYGYTCNDLQGYNNWYYLTGDILNPSELSFNDNAWKKDDVTINKNNIKLKNSNVIIQFISNFTSNATIYGFVKPADGTKSDITFNIYQNGNNLYTKTINKDYLSGYYYQIDVNLKEGEKIDLEILGDGKNTCLATYDMVITTEKSYDSTLYHLNDLNKQYGDVFPWYNEEENRLEIWYLWSDDCNKEYNYAIDVSYNMLKTKTYQETNNYNLYNNLYQNYLYSRVFNVNNYYETSKYTFGIRDNFMSFDKENNRYLLIGGCYYTFKTTYPLDWKSDLVIYSSNDEFALDWNYNGNVIDSYDGNLPECPSLLKIGNRWYPFVSVSHVTTHQIGGLKYWIGPKDVDCLNVNYQECLQYFIDGEDLCAARPTYVKDQVYMWGWITASPDSVPLSPWAGYLNLPRLIVQNEDGTLGGTMDSGLEKYLNYGTIEYVDNIKTNNNVIDIINNQKRNFITYDVDMTNAETEEVMFVQDGKRYTCGIEKDNDGKIYLRIRSLDDDKHSINSSLEILHPSKDNKYHVRLVIDEGKIEFFVNDNNSLTASTKLTKETYDIKLSSKGECTFTNVEINKLRSYNDCE